jgi:RimJ/RimL family protein N-acetyltransferase
MTTHPDSIACWQARSLPTERLTVRAFQPQDAADLFTYLSRPEVYRFEPGEPLDWEGAQNRALEFSTSPEFWAVELQAERKVIGQVYFSQTEPQHTMTWELGYILSPDYQRQGYASEAAAALVQAGFAAAGIHRVVSHCNPENAASWRLLEKIGFRREGLLKKNIYFRKNAAGEPIWTDTYIYARLAEE